MLFRPFRALAIGLDRLAWFVVFLMMIYTVVDVLALKVAGFALLGTVETTALLMVLCVFFSFAQTEWEDGHIRVDFVYNKLGKRAQQFSDLLTQFLAAALFGVMGWAALLNGFEKLSSDEVTMDLLLPLFPFAFVAGAGCCLIAVALLSKTVMAFQRMVHS